MKEGNKIKAVFFGLKSQLRLFFVQEYFKNRIIDWLIASSIILNIANWLIIKIFIKPVEFQIILHYNVYFGVDMIGNWQQAYWMPAVGLFLFLINLILSFYFWKGKERIASYLLLMAALMIQLSLIVASISVAIINY